MTVRNHSGNITVLMESSPKRIGNEMKNQNLFRFLILLNSMLLLAMLAGCGAAPATHSITVTTDTSVPATETPTIDISPTAASTATATAPSVAASTAAPLPGCSIPYFEPVA